MTIQCGLQKYAYLRNYIREQCEIYCSSAPINRDYVSKKVGSHGLQKKFPDGVRLLCFIGAVGKLRSSSSIMTWWGTSA